MEPTIIIESIDPATARAAADEAEAVIRGGLHEHNLAVLGPEVIYHYYHIVFTARNGGGGSAGGGGSNSKGTIIGGLVGDMIWDFLHIDVLWVAEPARGQDIGSRLIEAAERLALERGFPRLSLETTSFQALAFYQKHGFAIAGQVANKPKGHTWYFLEKELGR